MACSTILPAQSGVSCENSPKGKIFIIATTPERLATAWVLQILALPSNWR